MNRYEVEMADGWKFRLNANDKAHAMRKAEGLIAAKGERAVSAKECGDVNPRDFA